MYRPVALDDQAKELLRAGKYSDAIQLADTCSGEGAPWAESAFAQAAFLLLHGVCPLPRTSGNLRLWPAIREIMPLACT